MKHIIKRHGYKQKFDEKKLYASVYSSALNAHHSQEIAEKIASNITQKINKWISSRAEISSHEIFKKVKKMLDDSTIPGNAWSHQPFSPSIHTHSMVESSPSTR